MNPDRLPPNAPEAEDGAIGCILWLPEQSINACSGRIDADAFYNPINRVAFEYMCRLHFAGKPVDMITVIGALKDSPFSQTAWTAFLNRCQDATPSAANLPYYLDILAEKATLRKIIHFCAQMNARAYDFPSGNTDDLIDEFEKGALMIRPKRSLDSIIPVRELTRMAIDEIEDTWRRQGGIEGIETGFGDLDKVTGGLKPGEMTVVAGYPGAGKTSFAMNMAEHAMLQCNRKVGVFSLEMSAVSLVKRFICSHSKVSLRNISSGFLSQNDFPKISSAAAAISKAAIWFDDSSDLSIHNLRSKARRMKQEFGIEMLVVDYLQLLNASGGSRKVETRQQEVTDISRGMKGIAKELSIPVVVLSQLNDDGKLRESRAIGQDADNVWILKEEDNETAQDTYPVKLKIVKNRNGPRNYTVNLVFLSAYTRFESASKIDDADVPAYKSPYHD